ncbi:MAG: GGDEF domain-containing protein, partial [Oscillospiraceae bacterium]|nr:GGDEF domain-containing protein [Oscillospiraceae bacterium]
HTNILTGMRNRYALDSYLSRLIGNAQFNLAVFDMDNFRVVNDTYGYEVGDEYLCVVSDRLNEEFGSSGELYNISGNEFCIIFKEEIGDMQAQQLAEQIRQSIGRPATVAGIVLQSPVSASLYHCLPSEGMDVNGLLMKMDSALHQAKRDGGDRLYYIQQ